MFKGIISYIRKLILNHHKSCISQKDLEEFMRVEGITYVDIFPRCPTIPKGKYK